MLSEDWPNLRWKPHPTNLNHIGNQSSFYPGHTKIWIARKTLNAESMRMRGEAMIRLNDKTKYMTYLKSPFNSNDYDS